MKSSMSVFLGTVLSFAFVWNAVGQDHREKGVVIYELGKNPDDYSGFNPFSPTSVRENGSHQAMWEPLFSFNLSTGQLEPWLADSIKSNAAQDVWTLIVRDGVFWSDQRPFTAEDIRFTVDMVLRSENLIAMEAINLRAQVESVERLDDHRVRFKLRKPNPRFALENFGGGMFGSFMIMPAHIWLGQDPVKYRFPKPIGTGPYLLESATKERVTWMRNPKWWGVSAGKELPKPEKLVWQYFRTEAESMKALVDDELDAAREYSLENFNRARQDNEHVVGWSGGSATPAWNEPCPRQLEFNTLRPPWSDPRLRKAMSLLISRKQLVKDG